MEDALHIPMQQVTIIINSVWSHITEIDFHRGKQLVELQQAPTEFPIKKMP